MPLIEVALNFAHAADWYMEAWYAHSQFSPWSRDGVAADCIAAAEARWHRRATHPIGAKAAP